MRDLFNNLSVVQAVKPVVATSSQTSTSIDLQGYDSALVLFAIGASGDSLSGSVYWTLKLQESDDGSSYSDVATTGLLNDSATVVIDSISEDETVASFGYTGGKRYIRAVATATGTHTNGTPLGVLAIRGHAALQPVA